MAAGDSERRSRPAIYPFLFRRLHWLLVPSTVVMILTGFSLHAGSRPDWSLLGGTVPGWFWTGRAHYWHAWSAPRGLPVAGFLALAAVTSCILMNGGPSDFRGETSSPHALARWKRASYPRCPGPGRSRWRSSSPTGAAWMGGGRS